MSPRGTERLQSDLAPGISAVIGRPPAGLVRWGTGLLAFLVGLLLLLSCWIRFPETVFGQALLSGQEPAVAVKARESGSLARVWVRDGQLVEAQERLALLENPTDWEAVQALKAALGDPSPSLPEPERLGDLRSAWGLWRDARENAERFRSRQDGPALLAALRAQQKEQGALLEELKADAGRAREARTLAEKAWNRAQTLARGGILGAAGREEARLAYLGAQREAGARLMALRQGEVQALDLQRQIRELERNLVAEEEGLLQAQARARRALEEALDLWERRYLLRAPGAGRISLYRVWHPGQYLGAGETFCLVDPPTGGALSLRIQVPLQGLGKVAPGQKVRLELSAFPALEFGALDGKVEAILPAPGGESWTVLCSLPRGARTRYGRILPLRAQMEGTAEILTDNRPLIFRVLQPLRAALDSHGGS